MISEIYAYIEEDRNAVYKMVIGTDSQTNHKETLFITAIIIHRVGKRSPLLLFQKEEPPPAGSPLSDLQRDGIQSGSDGTIEREGFSRGLSRIAGGNSPGCRAKGRDPETDSRSGGLGHLRRLHGKDQTGCLCRQLRGGSFHQMRRSLRNVDGDRILSRRNFYCQLPIYPLTQGLNPCYNSRFDNYTSFVIYFSLSEVVELNG